MTQFEIVGITDEMIDEASSLARKHGLRAYDAVQLAAALHTRRIVSAVGVAQLALVSADVDLNAAATAEGLSIDDPNTH
jgi:predicted nucleic acid-binding protein